MSGYEKWKPGILQAAGAPEAPTVFKNPFETAGRFMLLLLKASNLAAERIVKASDLERNTQGFHLVIGIDAEGCCEEYNHTRVILCNCSTPVILL